MTMTMQEIFASRAELHSSPETMGTRCHLCPNLSCNEQEGAKVHKWMYYCPKLPGRNGGLGRRMTFKELHEVTKEECPKHREINRRFR